MKRQVINELWNSYAREVMPKAAGPVQRAETRQAFYAGASAVFYSIMGMLSAGQEAQESDLQLMQNLQDELTAFTEQAKRGSLQVPNGR